LKISGNNAANLYIIGLLLLSFRSYLIRQLQRCNYNAF